MIPYYYLQRIDGRTATVKHNTLTSAHHGNASSDSSDGDGFGSSDGSAERPSGDIPTRTKINL